MSEQPDLLAMIQALEKRVVALEPKVSEPTHVTADDLRGVSRRIHGLGLDWLVFATTVAQRAGKPTSPEMLRYLKETFDGMRDLLDDFAKELEG